MPDSELRAPETDDIGAPELSKSRSQIVSTVYAVFGLIFFFGAGLAGGGAYRLWSNNAADQAASVSTNAAPPSLASAAPSARITPSDSTPLMPGSTTGPAFVAPKLAEIAPTEPSLNAPPSATPTVPMPNTSAMEVSPASAPNTANIAPLAAAPAKPARSTQLAAVVPPKKLPAKPAIAERPHPAAAAGDTVALHKPPAAPDNTVGPYRIQFGAFANEDNARKVQWAIEATGLNADVTVQTGSGSHALYFVRSPTYPDYAAALSSAQTVQSRVQHFVNAIPIEYVIIGDHGDERGALAEQQAEAH